MDLVALLVRTMISLAVVLAVVAVAYRIARRRAGGGKTTSASRSGGSSAGVFGRRRSQPAPIEVVGRVGLTRGTSAVALRFGDRVVLVAAADQARSTVLAEMTAEEWNERSAPPEIATPVRPTDARGTTRGSPLADTTRPSFVEALRQATSRHG